MGKRIYIAELDEYKNLAEVLKKPTELDDDFLPRIPITLEEVSERYGAKRLAKETVKKAFKEHIKSFNKATDKFNEDYVHGVHLKYMGNSQIIAEGNHTMNAELMFNNFIHNLVAKRHLDTAYAVGEGVKNLLHSKEHGKEFKNTIAFLEDQMQIHILGRDRKELDKGFKIRIPKFDVRTGKAIPNEYWFWDVSRFLIAAKSFTSAITMWLKPIGGTMNTFLITMLNLKEAVKGSILKIKGVSDDDIDFTLSDLKSAQGAIAQYWADSFAGKVRQNKLHVMMKTLDFLPSNFEYSTTQTKLYSGKTRWFDTSNFFVFHGLGEEWGQMTLLVAQLMRKKHKGKSLWEHYIVNEDGILEWTGGERFQRTGPGKETRSVTGLEPEEITKLKRITARIHGGYRHEEKVALELTALGKWALQFKKYLPSVIENAIVGKYEDVTLGTWEKVEGENVYEWVARINEGRILVMGKHIFAAINKRFGSGQIYQNYLWDELDVEQQKQILDFYTSWAMWTALTFGMAIAFDDDDDNPWAQRFETKIQDLTQSWNPLDFGRALKEPTVVIPRTYKLMDAAADYFLKGVLQGRRVKSGPNKGRYIGETQLRKGIPFIATDEELSRFGLR